MNNISGRFVVSPGDIPKRILQEVDEGLESFGAVKVFVEAAIFEVLHLTSFCIIDLDTNEKWE